MIVLHT